jgi:hypothetical protein
MEHQWKTTHVPTDPKEPTELKCDGCGTCALQFDGNLRVPVAATVEALLKGLPVSSVPRISEDCVDMAMARAKARYAELNPPRSAETWAKAVCRVLDIASERVEIATRPGEWAHIPIVKIDGQPLGVAISDFVKDEPGKSRFGLVDAIYREARAIGEHG